MPKAKRDKHFEFTCGDLEVLVSVGTGDFPEVQMTASLGPWTYKTRARATPSLQNSLVARLFKTILQAHPELARVADLDGGEPLLSRIA